MLNYVAPEDAAFDVIVVGGGGAGLAAAIEARAAGAEVLLIEKNASPGGSTAWSIGSVTATGTPHQARLGIVDRADDHWADMAAFNGNLDSRDNPVLRRILAGEMPETFRWLLAHGIRFYGPMPEPPHRRPRMHNVLPNSRSFIVHLARAARDAGVMIATHAREFWIVLRILRKRSAHRSFSRSPLSIPEVIPAHPHWVPSAVLQIACPAAQGIRENPRT
jgi:succinate dehydrogenase/fumarate reductase flavoprotein subunit